MPRSLPTVVPNQRTPRPWPEPAMPRARRRRRRPDLHTVCDRSAPRLLAADTRAPRSSDPWPASPTRASRAGRSQRARRPRRSSGATPALPLRPRGDMLRVGAATPSPSSPSSPSSPHRPYPYPREMRSTTTSNPFACPRRSHPWRHRVDCDSTQPSKATGSVPPPPSSRPLPPLSLLRAAACLYYLHWFPSVAGCEADEVATPTGGNTDGACGYTTARACWRRTIPRSPRRVWRGGGVPRLLSPHLTLRLPPSPRLYIADHIAFPSTPLVIAEPVGSAADTAWRLQLH